MTLTAIERDRIARMALEQARADKEQAARDRAAQSTEQRTDR